jgi:hypothetical protein
MRKLSFVFDDVWQIGQLMNDDLGPRFHDGVTKRSGIENIDDNAVNARGVELARSHGVAGAAGDLVPGRK